MIRQRSPGAGRRPVLVLSLLGGLLAGASWLTPLATLEPALGLDFLYAMRGPRPTPANIVVVAMNGASARALGVPPRADRWPRRLHAELVDGLHVAGVRAIGFDLLFARPRDAGDDAALAQAIRRSGNVVLAETVERDFVRDDGGRVVAAVEASRPPLPLFADAARATAPFVLPKTPYGVFEFWGRVPTLGDRPSLPGRLAELLGVASDGIPDGAIAMNLYGPIGSFETIAYPTALEMLADPARSAHFAGKAVLVGYSETNQSRQVDAYQTPYTRADGVDVSGVELCATALANLQDGSWLARPGAGVVIALLMLHAGVLVLPWTLVGTRAALVAMLGMQALYGVGAVVAFASYQLWLPVVLPLAVSPMIAVALGASHQQRRGARRRRELEHAIEFGLSPEALARLSSRIGDVGSGRTLFAVCLCSDIVAFTRLSEGRTPQAVRDMLDLYLDRFAQAVEAHGGHIADMVADSVLSLWFAEEDSAEAVAGACAAALRLDREMNGPHPAPGALRTRLGLHCGPIFYGAVGRGGRRELHAVGDIVNTSSRIEGANKYLGTRVLVSGQLSDHIGDDSALRPLGRFALAGKEQVLELLELGRGAASATVVDRFAEGLAAYQRGDLGQAKAAFEAAVAAGDDGPAAFYLRQCEAAAAVGATGPAGVAVLPGK
ncbi:MAG: adenylate/guanylate cyclase domain-containing protein [Rhodocyclaceae bacterium]|nr:adenylate/guanylate cyclase domain-containing protein [Rhodocyclaceae bacterium]